MNFVVAELRKWKLRFLILILPLIVVACTGGTAGDETERSAESQIPANAIVQNYESIDGLQRVVVREGEVTRAEGDFFNGRHHGTWVAYDASGKVTSITTYYFGERQGVELLFDNLGYVASKAYYYKDQLDGEYLIYKRRNITERRNYSSGSLHGPQKKYYVDGTTMEESSYVDGKIDGIARWYDSEGNLTIEYTYEMGALIDN